MTIFKDPHSKSRISDLRIIELPSICVDRSLITVADNGNPSLPFEVRRVYYLYNLPALAERGGHSHRNEHRLLVAVAGCFDVTVDDGVEQTTVTLRHPRKHSICRRDYGAQSTRFRPGRWLWPYAPPFLMSRIM